MQKSVSDLAAPKLMFANKQDGDVWLATMSKRLQKRMPDKTYREDFLKTVHYEATRAGLDPQLVLSLIQVESAFKKYAVSRVGARGYMQVMPFWVKAIGSTEHNLFHLKLNLRYGCTILRHYLAIERGNLFRALGRYNGSLGKAKYPNLVLGKWRKYWHYSKTVQAKNN
jgi:soluble lytic murein transglycosylase-like protein